MAARRALKQHVFPSPADVETDVIPIMVERLVRAVDPVEIVLFGSYARGEAGPDSDVDLLIVLDDDTREKRDAVYDAVQGLGTPKDVVTATPETLAQQAHIRGLIYRAALREGKSRYRRGGAATPWWKAAQEGTMTPEEIAAETRRWLNYARDDLTGADLLLGAQPPLLRGVCFHAQQAAEKALKAALIWQGAELSRTHDLDGLRNLLSPGWGVKASFPDLKPLSAWAVRARYPGPEPSEADARGFLARARALYEQVVVELGARGLTAEETP